MGNTPPAQANTRDTASSRRRSDRRLLLLFAALVGISIAGSAASYPFVGGVTIYDLMSIALGGLTLSFLVAGIPAFVWNRTHSLTPRRTILRWIAVISLVVATVSIFAIAMATIYAPDLVQLEDSSFEENILIGVIVLAILFVISLAVFTAVFLAAVGAIGVMSALERLIAPWTLRQIAHLGEAESQSLFGRVIGWLFDIPNVLDTSTLSLRPAKPRAKVSLSDLRAPVLWQMVFGFVLGIYISFNPFMSDRSPAALLGLFSLLTSACILIPLIILPWFLFRRLGAGIEGQVKQFTLYNGIRARVFQSYFAVGTFIILLRMSVQEIAVALETYVVAFAAFMTVLLGSAFLGTFVYFNYFENELAEDIVDELRGTEIEIVDSQPEDWVLSR